MTAESLTASQVWHRYGHDPRERFARVDELRRLRAANYTLESAVRQLRDIIDEQETELAELREKLYGPKGEA